MFFRARLSALFLVLIAVLWSSPAIAGDDPWPDISGHWIVEQTNTAHSQVPVVGTLTSTTTAQLIVDIEQRGPRLRITSTTCTVDIEDATTLVRTILPDPFITSIPTSTRSARLVRDDEGVEIQLPRHYMSHGARMEDPRNEEMPEDDTDPRVYDQDGDGNYGVTVKIEGIINGEIYVVQRSWDAWRGRLVDDDSIDGFLFWGVDQTILGASNRFLRIQPETTADEDPTNNPFSMRRADGPVSCRDL